MKNLKFKFIGILFLTFISNQFLFASEKEKICPFELISFDYRYLKSPNNDYTEIELIWKTASEMNTDKFIVERNDDTLILGSEFHPIGEVAATGNSNEIKTYNYFDTIGFGTFTYRIKGVDKDSSFSYSNEITIDNYYNDVEEQSKSNPLIENIYPNPSNSVFNISLNTNSLVDINLSILNIKGQILKSIKIESSNNLIIKDLSEFTSGEYYINVSRGTNFELRKISIIK